MGQFRFLTAGESHGKGLTAIVEGMIAGLPLDVGYINTELKRRQQGYGRSSRMQLEEDKAEIISGIYHGLTTGSPISLFISNRDWRETEPVTCPRPGHADLAGVTKYGLEDIRPIMERASARETAARVAVGAIAKRFLEQFGIAIHSHTMAIGHVTLNQVQGLASCHCQPTSIDWQRVESSPVRCSDTKLEKEILATIDKAKADGDTLGGIFEVIATGVPIGLGSHVHWDRRLNGRIAQAIMSINAVKGVEVGMGFALAALKGSQAHDIIEPNPLPIIEERSSSSLRGASATKQSLPWRYATNRAGGIEGGISNGEPIVVRAVVKPIATLAKPLPSIDLHSGQVAQAHYERSDVCVIPAAGVIAEAMLAIVLADAMLEKFGGDNLKETNANYHNYQLSCHRF
ncbi:MAG: chorismate synthase [Chloroflexi bacterium CG08_land_8_20_14_0_20_45_12]|nr:MAG: chorismate synthase [Chloroflexi bacterium CG08_land_8_20_14_0_20_45_12]